MIFHENRLLADDSHVISYLIFVENWGKMSQNLSSAAVVIGALRVRNYFFVPQPCVGGFRPDHERIYQQNSIRYCNMCLGESVIKHRLFA